MSVSTDTLVALRKRYVDQVNFVLADEENFDRFFCCVEGALESLDEDRKPVKETISSWLQAGDIYEKDGRLFYSEDNLDMTKACNGNCGR